MEALPKKISSSTYRQIKTKITLLWLDKSYQLYYILGALPKYSKGVSRKEVIVYLCYGHINDHTSC